MRMPAGLPSLTNGGFGVCEVYAGPWAFLCFRYQMPAGKEWEGGAFYRWPCSIGKSSSSQVSS